MIKKDYVVDPFCRISKFKYRTILLRKKLINIIINRTCWEKVFIFE